MMRFGIVLLGLVCTACSKAPQAPPGKLVEVETIQKKPFKKTLRLIGIIEPKHESVLTAKASGAVDTHVHTGEFVKKGTVIASLQIPDAHKNVDLAQKEFQIAKDQFDRAQNLAKNRTISKQDVESRRVEYLHAEKQLYAAKTNLENAQFIAPFNGIVGVFRVREGAHMNAGDVLVTMFDPEKLVITFGVPEMFVNAVKKGDKVFVNKNQCVLQDFQKLLDPETHMAPALIDYPCKDCIVGSNVDVDVVLFEGEREISVPRESLFVKNEKTFVFLVTEGKANLQPITIGETEKDRVRVLSGINEGDQVVAKGIERLYPGIDVQVMEEKTSAPSREKGQ